MALSFALAERSYTPEHMMEAFSLVTFVRKRQKTVEPRSKKALTYEQRTILDPPYAIKTLVEAASNYEHIV